MELLFAETGILKEKLTSCDHSIKREPKICILKLHAVLNCTEEKYY